MTTALTRLTLTQRLARWSGAVLPSKVTDTASPTDNKVDDLVAFVDQAWLDIQLIELNRWCWMRNRLDDDSVPLTVDNRILTMAEIDATCRTIVPHIAHDQVPLRYVNLKHPTTESVHRCQYIEYEMFRGYRDKGDRPTQKPTRFTIRKNGDLEFDPIPDVAYTIDVDWMENPTELTADGTSPDMPEYFHMLVVWWAMVHLMGYDTNNGRYQTAHRQYKIMLNRLKIEQLPPDIFDEYLSTSEVYSW